MCVVVAKDKNVAFPSWRALERCFKSNPDGAGFMYAKNGVVHIQKGYMDFPSFKRALKKTRQENGDDLSYVMHFRIATHGGINEKMTQPFPLSNSVDKLCSVETNCEVGIAHNGIISMTSYAKDISDTAEFIKEYMVKLIDRPNYYNDYHISKIIDNCINSKMAVLSNDGHIEIIGSGWIKEDGIYYSNTSYESYHASKKLYDWDKYFPVDLPDFEYCDYGYDTRLEDMIDMALYNGYDCKAIDYGDSACYGCKHKEECWYW